MTNDQVEITPAVIQRALLEERLKQLEREFEKAVNLREQSLAAANEYGKLGVRLEGAMAVLKEMLATTDGKEAAVTPEPPTEVTA